MRTAALVALGTILLTTAPAGGAPNLLPRDTSFETPSCWYARISERPAPDGAVIMLSNRPVPDLVTAWHGRRSLRMRKIEENDRVEIQFPRVELDPARGLQLAGWARAEAPDTPLELEWTSPDGKTVRESFPIGRDWTLVTLPLPTDAEPGAYRTSFRLGPTTNALWLDAVQISTDPTEGYAPAEPLLLGGWIPQAENGFALHGESIVGDFGVFNASGRRDWITIYYEIVDRFGGWRDDAYNTIDVEAGEPARIALRFGRLPRGWYDLRVAARSRGGLTAGYRLQFAVVQNLEDRPVELRCIWSAPVPMPDETQRRLVRQLGFRLEESSGEEPPDVVSFREAADVEAAAERILAGEADAEPAAARLLFRFEGKNLAPEQWASIGLGRAYRLLRSAAEERAVPLVLRDAGSWWEEEPVSQEVSLGPAIWACRKGLIDAAWGVESWRIPPMFPPGWPEIDGGRVDRVLEPAGVALSFLTDVLTGKQYAGSLPCPEKTRALLFRGKRACMLVFWRMEDSPEMFLRIPPFEGPREVTTCAGAPLPRFSLGDEIRIPVSPAPRFLFVPGDLWETLRGALRGARFVRGRPGKTER